MNSKFQNLKNNLEDLEQEGSLSEAANRNDLGKSSGSKLANYILLFAFLASLIFYAGSKISMPSFELGSIDSIVQEFNQPSEDLLNRMGAWMEEMGYGELTHQQLTELRNEGVTATFTSQIRDVGYTDVTLEQLVELQNADVSATFARMMKELGYELTLQDLMELRRAGVTAYFTSNMMDLGYTIEELTKENLIRLRQVGVTQNMAEKLLNESDVNPSVDDLIRYRISNQ